MITVILLLGEFIVIRNHKKEIHDKIVSLVDTMLSSHATEGLTPQLRTTAITDGTKKAIQQKIYLVDKQIDKLVCELYGLTEEEIRIVEDKGN